MEALSWDFGMIDESRRRMIVLDTWIERMNGHDRTPGNRDHTVAITGRQYPLDRCRGSVDGDQTVEMNGMAGRMRPERGPIAAVTTADVGPEITAASPPPGIAAAHSRRPAPAEAVIPVPHAALVRQVAPGVGGDPGIAVAGHHHPVAVSVGIPTGIGGFIRRPDVALPGHVIPISVGIQVVPGRVRIVGIVFGGAGFGSGLRGENLVAVGVPGVPRVWFNRLV
jgi:hypothetical protein